MWTYSVHRLVCGIWGLFVLGPMQSFATWTWHDSVLPRMVHWKSWVVYDSSALCGGVGGTSGWQWQHWHTSTWQQLRQKFQQDMLHIVVVSMCRASTRLAVLIALPCLLAASSMLVMQICRLVGSWWTRVVCGSKPIDPRIHSNFSSLQLAVIQQFSVIIYNITKIWTSSNWKQRTQYHRWLENRVGGISGSGLHGGSSCAVIGQTVPHKIGLVSVLGLRLWCTVWPIPAQETAPQIQPTLENIRSSPWWQCYCLSSLLLLYHTTTNV